MAEGEEMDKFGMGWKDEDGLLIQVLYWATNGRFFRKYSFGGIERKAKRIGEAEYIRAYEEYRNY